MKRASVKNGLVFVGLGASLLFLLACSDSNISTAPGTSTALTVGSDQPSVDVSNRPELNTTIQDGTAATANPENLAPEGAKAEGAPNTDESPNETVLTTSSSSSVRNETPAEQVGNANTNIVSGPGRIVQATSIQGRSIPFMNGSWVTGNSDIDEPAKSINFARNTCQDAKNAGKGNVVRTVPLAWEAPAAHKDPQASLNAMRKVARGEYDYVYEGIAQAFKECGYDNAIVRLGSEHNMKWTPYFSGTIDGVDRSAAFKDAWIHVVKVMRSVAPDLVFDMTLGHVSASKDNSGGGLIADSAWPGDGYVDVVGLDIYCRGSNVGKPDRVLSALKKHADFAAEHNKPISYPEVGITLPLAGQDIPPQTGNVADCVEFIDTVFGFADKANLVYLTWFNTCQEKQGYRYRTYKSDTEVWRALSNHFGGLPSQMPSDSAC